MEMMGLGARRRVGFAGASFIVETGVTTTPAIANLKKLSNNKNKKKKLALCLCNKSDGTESENEGDKRKQELLAQIAMLQAQKVRLTDFLDERSAYLTKFGQEAETDFDQIGEKALKDLEDAGARIMEKMDIQMETFEESSEIIKQEIAKGDKVLKDFEEQIERELNQDLFFKSLKQKAPQGKQETTSNTTEARKLFRGTTIKNTGLKFRRNIYLGLMALVFGTIGNYVITTYPQVEWKKVSALGLILLGLIVQYIYEQSLSTTNMAEREDKENSEEDG